MNRIRKIQIFLLITMFILIAVVILNFNRGKQKKYVKRSTKEKLIEHQGIEAGSTKMEGGIHVLYRNGAPFATVHFQEAIQKKNQLHLIFPVVTMAGSPEKLSSDFADLKNDTIVLKGKIFLLSPKSKISISLSSPATFKNGILTGKNGFKLKLNGGIFSGTHYTLGIHEGKLLGERNAEFSNDNKTFCIKGDRGIADLKTKTLAFVRNVRITEENRSGNITLSDSAFLDTVSKRIFLSGKGEIKLSSGATIFFAEAIFRKYGNSWNGEFSSPLKLKENGRILYLPNALLQDGKLYFPWSILKSENTILTSAQGNFSLQNSIFQLKFPVFQKNDDLIISGKTFLGKIPGRKSKIQFPVVFRQNTGWISGENGKIISAHSLQMNGNVTGKIQNRFFVADTAKLSNGSIILKNSIIWDEDTRSLSSAKTFIMCDNQFSANGNYRMKQLQKRNETPLTLSASTAVGLVNGPIHLRGKVHAEIDELSIFALESYVYEWGAVFFNSIFSGKQLKQGKADFLIVLKKNHSVQMLGKAEIVDRKGNRLQGHKLTLSTITGRISVYSGKKKVRIKLAL